MTLEVVLVAATMIVQPQADKGANIRLQYVWPRPCLVSVELRDDTECTGFDPEKMSCTNIKLIKKKNCENIRVIKETSDKPH